MNPTSHDARARRPDVTSSIDQPICENEPPELIEVNDPTEDIANDITSELPGPSTRLRVVPQSVIGSGSVVANDDTAGIATVMTSGMVLRDRYVLEQPLGYGGTSVVMRARDVRRAGSTDQGADVAIKLLRTEFRDRPQCISRLKREFQQTQSLAHPNVVRFYDLDCDRGNWFIAMELLAGEPLGRRLRRAGPPGLPAEEALRIAAACGDALAYAHDHGVTHGDVKPDNVFVAATGEVRMLDFGVAPETMRQASSGEGAIAGPVVAAATRAYASPEVLSGEVPEPRDDVFSLSCVIYEMLAGRHPYGRRGADEARGAGLEIERLPGLSMQQWGALASGLAWSRGQRPGVRELLSALCADAPDLLPVQETAVLPVHIVEGQLLRRSGNKWRLLAVIGLAVVLGVLIGRFAFDSRIDRKSAPLAAPLAADTTVVDSSATDTATASAEHPVAILQAVPPPVVVAPAPELMLPGLVAFDAGSMSVSERAVVAPIPLRHLSSAERRVSVAWRALDGSAVAGRDYGGPQSGVAHFSEGNTFRMIYVPILKNARATGNRSFTVELTDVSPGASLGVTHRIVVTILDDA